MTIVYLVIILAAFYLLLVLEFVLPTGGLLGAAAVAAVIAAVAVGFSHSFLTGIGVILILLLTTPAVLLGLVRAWPHTPIGRRMLNRRPGETQAAPKKTTASGKLVEELVGRFGIAKSNLLPSGLVVVDGEKMDAVSSGMPIDAGKSVVVTHVELGKIHVREATSEELLAASSKPPTSPASLEDSLDRFDVE